MAMSNRRKYGLSEIAPGFGFSAAIPTNSFEIEATAIYNEPMNRFCQFILMNLISALKISERIEFGCGRI